MSRIVKAVAARFDNTSIYVHRRCKKDGRTFAGRYIRIGGLFKLGAPTLPSRQFYGLHRELFFTVNYPEYINDLLGIASDLPEVGGKGQPTIWMGDTTGAIVDKTLWYFLPKNVWGHKDGEYEKPIKTSTYMSIVTGEGGGHYYLLHVPLITRDFLRKRYRKFSLRGNP
ncbi:hypothetical protein LCGC14_1125610 [marine sediment metagenome]|uniref:Uncharacterized protein n=1 Tax=marine sediment metagenome TaxID=412755 RepID=A0A0F9Q8H0_9ZZZZ